MTLFKDLGSFQILSDICRVGNPTIMINFLELLTGLPFGIGEHSGRLSIVYKSEAIKLLFASCVMALITFSFHTTSKLMVGYQTEDKLSSFC